MIEFSTKELTEKHIKKVKLNCTLRIVSLALLGLSLGLFIGLVIMRSDALFVVPLAVLILSGAYSAYQAYLANLDGNHKRKPVSIPVDGKIEFTRITTSCLELSGADHVDRGNTVIYKFDSIYQTRLITYYTNVFMIKDFNSARNEVMKVSNERFADPKKMSIDKAIRINMIFTPEMTKDLYYLLSTSADKGFGGTAVPTMTFAVVDGVLYTRPLNYPKDLTAVFKYEKSIEEIKELIRGI